MSEVIKTYKKHGNITKDNIRIVTRKDRKKNDLRCVLCMKESDKKYYYKNYEKKSSYLKCWIDQNREHVNENNRKRWLYLKHTIGQNRLRKSKDNCINLTDSYIKDLLYRNDKTTFKYSYIPFWLIELKRELLKLKRKVREIKRCQ